MEFRHLSVVFAAVLSYFFVIVAAVDYTSSWFIWLAGLIDSVVGRCPMPPFNRLGRHYSHYRELRRRATVNRARRTILRSGRSGLVTGHRHRRRVTSGAGSLSVVSGPRVALFVRHLAGDLRRVVAVEMISALDDQQTYPSSIATANTAAAAALSVTSRRPSAIAFGCLNVRSIEHKIDAVLDVCRDRQIDVLCLVETWHDVDSVAFRRLRVDGFTVVDRPRLRPTDCATMSSNHGGVAICAVPGVRLFARRRCRRLRAVHHRGRPPELKQVSSAVIVVVYRPGSTVVHSAFYDELASVFEAVVAYQLPVYVVGDFNVRLDRPDDPHTRQLLETVDGLVSQSGRPARHTFWAGSSMLSLPVPMPLAQTSVPSTLRFPITIFSSGQLEPIARIDQSTLSLLALALVGY
jgi:exonuclease III